MRRPEMLRLMTRRWISEVPSKIVKLPWPRPGSTGQSVLARVSVRRVPTNPASLDAL